MTKHLGKILEMISHQNEIRGRGAFRDEVDNINGLEEALRHLSLAECDQLGLVRENAAYRAAILSVVRTSKSIAPTVRDRITLALTS